MLTVRPPFQIDKSKLLPPYNTNSIPFVLDDTVFVLFVKARTPPTEELKLTHMPTLKGDDRLKFNVLLKGSAKYLLGVTESACVPGVGPVT